MRLSTKFVVSPKEEKQNGTRSGEQHCPRRYRETNRSFLEWFIHFLQDVVIFSANLRAAWLSLDEADNLMLDDYHLLTGNKKHKCIPQLKPNKAN